MMRRCTWQWIVLLSVLAACAKSAEPVMTVLPPPAGTKPEAAALIEQGNGLFASQDWPGAEQAFRQALAADAGSAEAHYNLALTLDRMGKKADAKKHYIEAANLAPGHKIIWNSPPLRANKGTYGFDVEHKSYQDPTYKGF